MDSGLAFHLLHEFTPLTAVLWILIVGLLWVVWHVYKRGIDPSDLVVGDDGKLSWTKLLGCTGGIVFTYGFAHLITIGQLGEWYFNGYGLICFGTAFAYKLQALKTPPQQTVTTTTGTDAKVETKVTPPTKDETE